MSQYHQSVMREEVLRHLLAGKGRTIVDATLGGGGHAWDIYQTGARVVGFDVDADAIAECRRQFFGRGVVTYVTDRPKVFTGKRVTFIQENFSSIQEVVRGLGISSIDGIVFDLGVSSHQLDSASRGFSYKADGPFDLRFDREHGVTASELIAKLDERGLYEVIARFGEEELAGSIARAIVRARQVRPIVTTAQMVEIVEQLAQGSRRMGILSRVFQAFRIAVNGELDSLIEGLDGGISLLRAGGRIVVLSYHSLEDRIVKRRFMSRDVTVITKQPIMATADELVKNTRSRSAKLRVGEKRI